MNHYVSHYLNCFQKAAEESAAVAKPKTEAAPAPVTPPPPPIKPLGPQHPPILLRQQQYQAKVHELTPVPILQRPSLGA